MGLRKVQFLHLFLHFDVLHDRREESLRELDPLKAELLIATVGVRPLEQVNLGQDLSFNHAIEIDFFVDGPDRLNRQEVDAAVVELDHSDIPVKSHPEMRHVILGNDRLGNVDVCQGRVASREERHQLADVSSPQSLLLYV